MAAGSKSVLLWLALLAVVVFVISSESVIARELAENSNGAQLEQHSTEALGEEKGWIGKGLPKIGHFGHEIGHASHCPPGCRCESNSCNCCDK